MNLESNTASNMAFTDVPRFVRAVYDMLQNEDQCILSWSADGSHFQVYDVPRLESEVLRKYFKHAKFSSFQRQLNNFGFHKWTKTRASVATFSHDVLVRCHPSQLIVLVSQMKLKQKAVTTTTTTPVKETPSMKRPRSLLDTTTTQYSTSTKKYKMSPRDVCVVDELSEVSFASCVDPLRLLEDDICSSKDDLLLLDTLNSVEVATVDWDVAVSSVDVSDSSVYSDGDSSTFNVDVDVELGFYFKLDCVAATDVLVEADVFAILDCLEISQAILDCEMKALLGGVSNNSNADADILQFV